MTTVADLVQDVRRELHGMHRSQYASLGSSIDSDDTTLTLGNDDGTINAGTLLAIDDELIMVWSVTGASYTVQRAMFGTTGAAHTGDALVEVNPRFPSFSIKDALKKEIRSWEPRVFAVATDTSLDAAAGERQIDLSSITGTILDVLKVTRGPRSGYDSKFEINFRFERELDALYLDSFPESAVDLSITYAKPFDLSTFADATDVEATVGMSDTQFDIAVYGAAWRLVIGREIKRNFMEEQPDPRTSAEVPPGAIANSGRVMKALRDERLREEMNRLRARFPFRKR